MCLVVVWLVYAVGSASLRLLRLGRWRCHLRIVAGRQTGSRPILRSAAGIWPAGRTRDLQALCR